MTINAIRHAGDFPTSLHRNIMANEKDQHGSEKPICFYCGGRLASELDHRLSLALAHYRERLGIEALNHPDNANPLCGDCHARKNEQEAELVRADMRGELTLDEVREHVAQWLGEPITFGELDVKAQKLARAINAEKMVARSAWRKHVKAWLAKCEADPEIDLDWARANAPPCRAARLAHSKASRLWRNR
tara:strand:- start:407 stop:976 length:570 start_codon:yes stop_codon:yes gene_type:complete